MVLTRPELELKRRAPLAGGQPGTHEFVRAATVVVGFADTCDFICNSVADNVEIQAAIVYVNTLGGGSICVLNGTYDIIVVVELEDNIVLEGVGYSTHLRQGDDTNLEAVLLVDTKSNVTIKNLRVDGNQATQTSVLITDNFGIKVTNSCQHIIVERNHVHDFKNLNITLYGGTAVSYSTHVIIDGNFSYDAGRDGISCDDYHRYIDIVDNICYDNVDYQIGFARNLSQVNIVGNILIGTQVDGQYGIYIASGCTLFNITGNYIASFDIGIGILSSSDNTVTGNICYNHDLYGIWIYSSSGNTVTGNTCEGNLYGIFLDESYDNTVTGNTCNGNTYYGINLDASIDNTLTGNTCYLNLRHGISLITVSDNNTLTGNTCNKNKFDGIFLDESSGCTIVGNTCNENDVDDTGTYSGIVIYNNSDDNLVMSNTCNENDKHGIEIITATSERNWVKNNQLRGNGVEPFLDGGTDTKLATVPIPLIQGTTFISTAGEAWGWEINADTNFALGIGWLPLEVQQVVRIRVIGVGLAAPGAATYMRIQITGEGATFDEVFTTEPIDVVDHNNEEVNFAIDDVINWVFTATDDADIGQLLGGDRLQIKVLHEGAAGDGIATNAIVDSIQVEVV